MNPQCVVISLSDVAWVVFTAAIAGVFVAMLIVAALFKMWMGD